MMTPAEFATHLYYLGSKYHGSVTSWGRTIDHNAAVGGVSGSPHTHWMGADIVWDHTPDYATLEADANVCGLHVVREKDHDHLQPLDWRLMA